jgi:hypothetical protein
MARLLWTERTSGGILGTPISTWNPAVPGAGLAVALPLLEHAARAVCIAPRSSRLQRNSNGGATRGVCGISDVRVANGCCGDAFRGR